MQDKLVIAVGGPPGSGKTTIAKLISKKLNLRHISIGALFRKMAEERGLSLIDFSMLAQRDPSIDLELDSIAIKEAQKGGVVIDGHAAPWLLKGIAHLRVIVTASKEIRIRRLAERDGKPIDIVRKETELREQIERERYLRIYGIDIYDFSNFDLIINSEKFSPEAIAEIIITALKALKLI